MSTRTFEVYQLPYGFGCVFPAGARPLDADIILEILLAPPRIAAAPSSPLPAPFTLITGTLTFDYVGIFLSCFQDGL
jgi:hypothetical protein